MFGITKTIPAKEGREAIDKLYNGSISEYEFHMAGTPKKLKLGDYVYTIFDDALVGRCEISRFEYNKVNPKSGAKRTLVFVKCPGTKFNNPIFKQGHRGTRYFEGINVG